MKKLSLLFLLLLVVGITFQSCSKSKTYAQQLKEEREAIQNFIDDNQIDVIDFDKFQAQDSMTVGNQYVLLPDNGVYMQIVKKGDGKKMPDNGMNIGILCRFTEVNIASNDTLLQNPIYDGDLPDLMICSKSNGSITGRFQEGYMTVYSSSVPSGWLVPLNYINLSRSTSNLAIVRLIVPSKQGQSDAVQYVYPCYYEISYQLENPIFD